MQTKHHILVVDDDARIRELLGSYLQNHHYYVTLADSTAQALLWMTKLRHDMIILDVMMPGEDGFTLLKKLRHSSEDLASIPVIMLTARGQVEERLEGLSLGADDYLLKPFEPQELLLRIQAVLRRTQRNSEGRDAVYFGPWRFVCATRQLFQDDRHVPLTTAEEILMDFMCQRLGQVIPREDLARLQGQGTLERSIDVQINRLRRKIEPHPKHPRYLQTVRHKGYIFQAF